MHSRHTNNLLAILAFLGTIAALAVLRAVLEPLMIAVFLSFVAMPIIRAGRRIGIPGNLLVVLVICGLLVGMGWTISVVYESLYDFLRNVPAYEQKLRPHLEEIFRRLEISTEILGDPREGVPWKTIFTSTPIAGYARSSIGGFLGWTGELLAVLTFLIFLLLDRADGSLDRRIIHAFSLGQANPEEVAPILEEIDRDIERYIVVKTGLSLLTGFLVAMVLKIFQIPFAILFGAVAFTLNFIPNVGSVVATVPPIVVAWIHFGGEMQQLLPLSLILIFTQVGVGNFLDPWMMGKSLRLSPTTVLFVLILWNFLWGIPGMVLAVPIAVVARIILMRIPDYRMIAVLMSDEDIDEEQTWFPSTSPPSPSSSSSSRPQDSGDA